VGYTVQQVSRVQQLKVEPTITAKRHSIHRISNKNCMV